jgi:hypothetical protein
MPLLCDRFRACMSFEESNEFEGIGAGFRSEMILAWGTAATFVSFMNWLCVCALRVVVGNSMVKMYIYTAANPCARNSAGSRQLVSKENVRVLSKCSVA